MGHFGGAASAWLLKENTQFAHLQRKDKLAAEFNAWMPSEKKKHRVAKTLGSTPCAISMSTTARSDTVQVRRWWLGLAASVRARALK